MKPALNLLNKELQKEEDPAARYSEWRESIENKRSEFPMWFPERDDVIIPQWAVKVSSCCYTYYLLQKLKVEDDEFGRVHGCCSEPDSYSAFTEILWACSRCQ